ncbi:SPFH domain-containing protein [Acholeplasma hippikon]|uniref:Membrane protease subunits, stomatin/prohibitin-like protein n=1 Tax=Acholeplasma hippikon TaxID=264636 RepID=A0A449BJ85_9MOLU|nr:SPFH domain-containing protein [Acholeplasma hippikon]VEU82525.1 membrane protease subunits, stomatin/prohibitin-like protein [Acholeplasma hippikon]
MPTALIILIIIFAVIAIILISGIRVVNQTTKYVVERMGAYHKTWGVGIHWLIPFIDRVATVVTLKEQVKDFDPQAVITKDNVTMQIDTIVFFQVTDPKLYAYGVDNPIFAIESLSATTLRNIIGELDLDATLTSRDIINEKMRQILDEATDPWGIKVTRVEVKNIIPPKDIREAMEKQMRAERERRQTILIAEGEKRAQILQAEGFSESTVLRAEAAKREAILKAEAEAEAIFKTKEAEALGIKLIKEAAADDAVLKIKAFEALAKVADGQSTKIIVPSNLADLAGTVTALAEVAQTKTTKKNTSNNQ